VRERAQKPVQACANAPVYTLQGGESVTDWKFAEADPSEKLAKLHHFSVRAKVESGCQEIRITVWEYASQTGNMAFFAQTEEDVNQHLVPFRPCGWGNTLFAALSACLRNIRKFEPEAPVAG